MLRYHRADSILLKCLRNLNYVCFAELVESDVVRKPLMMATKMTPVWPPDLLGAELHKCSEQRLKSLLGFWAVYKEMLKE